MMGRNTLDYDFVRILLLILTLDFIWNTARQIIEPIYGNYYVHNGRLILKPDVLLLFSFFLSLVLTLASLWFHCHLNKNKDDQYDDKSKTDALIIKNKKKRKNSQNNNDLLFSFYQWGQSMTFPIHLAFLSRYRLHFFILSHDVANLCLSEIANESSNEKEQITSQTNQGDERILLPNKFSRELLELGPALITLLFFVPLLLHIMVLLSIHLVQYMSLKSVASNLVHTTIEREGKKDVFQNFYQTITPFINILLILFIPLFRACLFSDLYNVVLSSYRVWDIYFFVALALLLPDAIKSIVLFYENSKNGYFYLSSNLLAKVAFLVTSIAILLPLVPQEYYDTQNGIISSSISYPRLVSIFLPQTYHKQSESDDEHWPIKVLDLKPGITGTISTIETLMHDGQYRTRFLKLNHCFLGGEYIDYRESIYPDFNLHAATAMIHPDALRKLQIHEKDIQKMRTQTISANEEISEIQTLTIGLGVGIATGYFQRNGFQTDVVEIEEAVVDMASNYFSFFDRNYQNGNIFIQDVHKWLKDMASDGTARNTGTDKGSNRRKHRNNILKKYDIIVHDVFSSAGLCPSLFTQKFFQQLKGLLKNRKGILAVNTISTYRGELSTLIANTLMSLFEYVECVVEKAESVKEWYMSSKYTDSNERKGANFHNFIFYASDSPMKIPKIEEPASIFDRLHEKRVDIWSWNTNNSFVITKDNCDILTKLQSPSLISHYQIMNYYFEPKELWLPLA